MAAPSAGGANPAHNVGELEGLQACKAATAGRMAVRVRCGPAADDAGVAPGGDEKKVHFIRHGEGHHNVAQREWRAQPGWDGVSEPYTLDRDPELRYLDPELTAKGMDQARDLQPRTAHLRPELLVVSPMRRATQTGLIAFEEHVSGGTLKVVAHELCHERAGRHTCDKRLAKSEAAALFPQVDYSLIEHEHDPYWGDGQTRESLPDLAARAAGFVEWLMARPERHLAVAAHSAFLLAVFNAVLDCDAEAGEVAGHFDTGEMRTVLLAPAAGRAGPPRREAPGCINQMPTTGPPTGPRGYVSLTRLAFAAVPSTLEILGQTVDVRNESSDPAQPRYLARGVNLGDTDASIDAILRFTDGTSELLTINAQVIS